MVLLPACAAELDWDTVKQGIHEQYPSVAQVTSAELWAALNESESKLPILLDARTSEEYTLSRLPGAFSTPTEGEALARLKGVQPDREIVVYCSVGLRSAALAERLGAHGFTNVRNLEGSIFEWANSGYPVFRADQRVNVVHPFDERWGELLLPELRAAPSRSHRDRSRRGRPDRSRRRSIGLAPLAENPHHPHGV